MLTKTRSGSIEAELGTFRSVRVFLTNVHSGGTGTRPSSPKNTLRRASGRRSPGVQSLFHGSDWNGETPLCLHMCLVLIFRWLGQVQLRGSAAPGWCWEAFWSYEDKTTKPSCSTSACASVIRVWVSATFSAYCSPPLPHYTIFLASKLAVLAVMAAGQMPFASGSLLLPQNLMDELVQSPLSTWAG